MSSVHFDLSLKLSQGKVHDFSGEVQKFSGEVQNNLGLTNELNWVTQSSQPKTSSLSKKGKHFEKCLFDISSIDFSHHQE